MFPNGAFLSPTIIYHSSQRKQHTTSVHCFLWTNRWCHCRHLSCTVSCFPAGSRQEVIVSWLANHILRRSLASSSQMQPQCCLAGLASGAESEAVLKMLAQMRGELRALKAGSRKDSTSCFVALTGGFCPHRPAASAESMHLRRSRRLQSCGLGGLGSSGHG